MLAEHPDWGPGIYPRTAERPFDGDYILEVVDKKQVVQLRYFIDREANAVNVIAVRSIPFGWM